MACTVYPMLKGKHDYADSGAAYDEGRYRAQALKNLKRKAAKLGMQLVPATA